MTQRKIQQNQLDPSISLGSGTGTITGPATTTDNSLARFSGIDGTVLDTSTVTVSDTGDLEATSLTATLPGASISIQGDNITGTSPIMVGAPGLEFSSLGAGTDIDTVTIVNGYVVYKGATSVVGVTASTASIAPNVDGYGKLYITALAANITFNAPVGTIRSGQSFVIRIKDNGTSRAIGWNAVYRGVGVTLPTVTVAGKLMYIGMLYNTQDSKWDVISLVREA